MLDLVLLNIKIRTLKKTTVCISEKQCE